MSPFGNASDKSAEMRRRVEEALRLKLVTDAPQSSADVQRLVQELQVQQIELEMQNEELKESRAAVEEASARYRDFYDFSPVGYFTLDCMGTIAELNIVGAHLLGFERARLMGSRLGLFVAEPDRPAFNEFLSRVIESRTLQSCQVSLERAGEPPRIVQIEAKLCDDGQTCRAVVLEITKYKRAESELARRVRQQAVVVDLGLRALEGLELQELMDRAVQAIAETLEVELCKVLELLPTGDKLLLRAGVGWRAGLVGQATVATGLDSQAGYTLQSQTPVVVSDLRREVRFHGPPLLFEHGVVSGLSVIIFGKDRPFGLLGAHTTRQRLFTEDDTHFLQAMAHVLATAIQRQQTEEAVRKSEASLEAAQASAHLGNWELDLQTQTGSWSREMFRLFGRDPALGPPTFAEFLEMVHPEDRPSLVQAQNTTFIAGQTQSMEFRSNPERGPLRYFETTLHTVQQQPGGSVRFIGTSLDITARKQAEGRLRFSEALLRRVLDTNPMMIFVKDNDSRVLVANRAMAEFYRLPLEDIVGWKQSDLHQRLGAREEDAQKWLADDRRVIETGEPLMQTVCCRSPEGVVHWSDTRKYPLLLGNGQTGVLVVSENISARKQAEEALRESYEFNKQIIATAQEGIVVYDRDLRFVVWNQFMERLTGYSKEQVLGRHPLELFPFLRETGVIAAIERALAGETVASPDAPHSLPATGKSGWTSARRGPLRNAKGEIIGVIGTVHDITERKLAEEALRTTQARIASIFESAMDAIVSVDEQQNIVLFNPAAEKMFGCSASTAIGQSIERFLPERHRLAHRDLVSQFIQTGRTTRPMGGKTVVTGLKAGGQEFSIEATIAGTAVNGQKLSTVFLRDLTERRQAEAELRRTTELLQAVADGTSDAVFVKDRQGRYLLFNAAAAQFVGRPISEVLGRDDTALFDLESAQRVIERDRRIMESGETTTEEEALTVLGITRTFLATKGPYRDANGSIIGIIGISRDITERKQAETERQRLYMELQVALERTKSLSRELLTAQETERSQLARELHDEVGQVLTAVSLKLHHLKSCCGEEPQRELDAGLRLIDNAINEVRNLSLNLRPPMLDLLGLEPTIRWCVDQHRDLAGWQVQLDLQLEARLPPNLEITCFRVVQAALTNIARHAKASQVEIEIRHSDLELELVVRDNGVGFDSREMRQRSEQGGSFGLSAMRQRVELAGGSFRIDSSSGQGQGTTIRAYFPLMAAMQ